MYCPNTKPWTIRSQLPAAKWCEGNETASGIQVVPEPIRSMEIPRAPVFIVVPLLLPCMVVSDCSTLACDESGIGVDAGIEC